MHPQPEQAAPDAEWDDEPTAVVNLETSPGRVSLEKHVEIMTGKRR